MPKIIRLTITPAELADQEKLRADTKQCAADLDYISMMTDVELPRNEADEIGGIHE